MVWIIDGGPGHRPGIEWEEGRLWTPSSYIPDDVEGRDASAMLCSPYAKYVFVPPRDDGEYNAQEFIDWRDDWSSVTATAVNSVGGYVFWLGDSSSCGGTEIAMNTSDPMQAFLRSTETKGAFGAARIARGGFFLLGDRQGPAKAATEIKKILFDCNLDFLVLAVHHTPGETAPDMSLTAVRHLIASIRWDVGPRKPIILMMGARGPIVGAGNDNIHIMGEASRGNMFVGDITDQDTAAKQQALIDRAGFLALNWWPMVAFVPNAENGDDVRDTMASMDNRLFHPLLIPMSGSGCPFNTTRNLTAGELADAELAFETPLMPPLAEPKVRTTSAWFWDFDSVKNSSYVRSWAVPRGNLDGAVANMDYMSDMQVVFESTPAWVGHPVFDKDFAMEFRMENRSMSNQVVWDRDARGPGNIPDLHGAKDQQEGWLTVITPFELSPTATAHYGASAVPVIPTWAKFLWMREITQEQLTDPGGDWLGIPGLPSPGEMIEGLLDLLEDALIYLPNRLGIAVDAQGFTKWSSGLNQPHVVMYGKPQYPDSEIGDEGVVKLSLNSAPFAIQMQTRNFMMNGDLGFVWPARVFNIIPIALEVIVQSFDPVLTPVGLTDWDDLWLNAIGSAGTTPLQWDASEVPAIEGNTTLRIVPFDTLKPLLDHKGDFPPMLDSDDIYLGRDLSSQLARIDITHPAILRRREPGGGGGGAPGPGTGTGFAPRGVITNWPLVEDREIWITQDYFGRAYAGYICGDHRSLDLVYSDGSQTYSTPILAAGPGTVRTGWCAECGPWVEITHQIPPLPSQNTITSHYLHLSQTLVTDGQLVVGGEQIGTMGSEGAGNALHLHFQLRKDSSCLGTINPCDVMPQPLNGLKAPHQDCYRTAGYGGSPPEELICRMFEEAIATAGEDPYITVHGNRLRKSDVAVAIARAESGAIAHSGYPPYEAKGLNYEGGLVTSIDRGLFQINSGWVEGFPGGQAGCPLCDAGIINPISIVTYNEPDFARPIQHSTDLWVPDINIDAALNISARGSVWTAWSTFNGRQYLDNLAPGCPSETLRQL